MSNFNKCIIFTGGKNDFSQSVKAYKNDKYYVICADKGYDYAIKYGFSPNILIGDLDSINKSENYSCEVITFPKEKDDTDTMLAIKFALKKHFDEIIIFGALGGRFDHTYANLQSLAYICENNAIGKIISDEEFISIIPPSTITIEQDKTKSLSLFSYSKKCEGLSISGVKYPIKNCEITNNFPIGISNEIKEKTAQISFKAGKLLIIQSKI